jgi:4-aminobutyrate aminotransferase
LAPGELSRCFFCSGDWEAIEAARQLARSATNRPHVIDWITPADPPTNQNAMFAAFERALAEAGMDNVAAIIAAPINFDTDLSSIGPFWKHVRETCDKHGVLLIFNETQTCMNRTGQWFACEHMDVVPDILILAGALANGLPLAAVMATDDLVARGSMPPRLPCTVAPIACVGAVATISFHRTARLGHRAERQGGELLDALTEAGQALEYVTNARGLGLMIGVDVVDSAGRPDAARCSRYLEQLKNWGILLGRAGSKDNVLTIMPPLTITEDQTDLIVRAIEQLERETKD